MAVKLSEYLNQNLLDFVGDKPKGSADEFRPKIPLKIVRTEGRYYIQELKKKPELLLLGASIPVQILCVDEDDRFYCRYHEDDSHRCYSELDPSSLQALLAKMEIYYEKHDHRKANSYKVQNITPIVGEVVVVGVNEIFMNLVPQKKYGGTILRKKYHRAEILEIKEDGVTVKLLDNYGTGGVALSHVYKIRPGFTERSPQVFSCELDGMDFFKWKKLVHKTLRTNPIRLTWEDYSLNKVNLEFVGKYTNAGLPLVHISIREIGTSKWVPLRTHILENLRFTLSPFNNLLNQSLTDCRVTRVDKEGHLWLQFKNDSELLHCMHTYLESYRRAYETYVYRNKGMTAAKLLEPKSGENEKKVSRSADALYIVSLEDMSTIKEKFYRVTLLGRLGTSSLVRVYCIDYGIERLARPRTIIPINHFPVEVRWIPPQVYKVHLPMIKSIDTHQSRHLGYELFRQEEMQAALVYEWPSWLRCPDVALYLPTEEDVTVQDDAAKLQLVSNLGELLCEKNLAEKYNVSEIKTILAKAEYVGKLKQKRRDLIERYSSNYGPGCSFRGENVQFLWYGDENETDEK